MKKDQKQSPPKPAKRPGNTDTSQIDQNQTSPGAVGHAQDKQR